MLQVYASTFLPLLTEMLAACGSGGNGDGGGIDPPAATCREPLEAISCQLPTFSENRAQAPQALVPWSPSRTA